MKRISLVVLIILLFDFSLARSLGGGFEATSFFSVTTSSNCDSDTPTSFGNCSIEDHSVAQATDLNLDSWWQSEEGDDPAQLNFTLQVS